jgi:predicted transport protein
VKNELLSYEGITHSVDRKYEVFYHGTRTVAKLSICNGILRLYVNLDPQRYDKRQYNHRDMSKFECHEKTPLRINVNSLEALRHAKVFIRIIRKKERLESVSGFVRIDYEKFYTLKENFIPKIFKGMFNKEKNKKGK